MALFGAWANLHHICLDPMSVSKAWFEKMPSSSNTTYSEASAKVLTVLSGLHCWYSWFYEIYVRKWIWYGETNMFNANAISPYQSSAGTVRLVLFERVTGSGLNPSSFRQLLGSLHWFWCSVFVCVPGAQPHKRRRTSEPIEIEDRLESLICRVGE